MAETMDTLNVHEEEDTQEGMYLTFPLGNEGYGIEIRYVTEIIGMQNITELPDVTHFVKGVINLRGKIIPVIDIRLRFGLKEREYDDRTCIIVIDITGVSVGLIVDNVSEVVSIPEKDVDYSESLNRDAKSEYIKAFGKLGDEVKILLDSERLFCDGELEGLSKAG
ncbi:chemotaxis protein CheW [candidate division KSB1 bacterium]